MRAKLSTQEHYKTIEAMAQQARTPEEALAVLRASRYSDDKILDILLGVAREVHGWAKPLNEIGLMVLKPDVADGEDRVSA